MTVQHTSPSDGWLHPDRALLVLRRRIAVGVVGVPVALAVTVSAQLAGPVQALACLVVGAVLLGLLLLAVDRRWRAWAYLEREDDLVVQRGVLVRRTSVVPYGRMQYVDVTAGPLDRRFGLATVTLHTAAAATDAFVPGLLADEAARLRDRLAALGEARQAGL
jgi:membrane protein YdbS with pleckstrin-like domain